MVMSDERLLTITLAEAWELRDAVRHEGALGGQPYDQEAMQRVHEAILWLDAFLDGERATRAVEIYLPVSFLWFAEGLVRPNLLINGIPVGRQLLLKIMAVLRPPEPVHTDLEIALLTIVEEYDARRDDHEDAGESTG